MWMVDVKMMCDKHLLEEHNECHKIVGIIHMKGDLEKYCKFREVEVLSLKSRHDEVVEELKSRGYAHSSPLRLSPSSYSYLPSHLINKHINRQESWDRLIAYCGACRKIKIKNLATRRTH